jgi:endonuclease/exonuclease/phosphatase family metal-dependent hydrolase
MKRNVIGIATAAIIGALVAGIATFALMRDRSGIGDMKRIAAPITVLTYNTHLFEGSNAVPANDIVKGRPIVHEDGIRAEFIAQKLETCGADIVALQELWACDRPQWFAERLKKVYPYSYYYIDGCTGVTFETLNSEVREAGAFALLSTCLKKNSATCKGLFKQVGQDLIRLRFGHLVDDVLKYVTDQPKVQEAGRDVIKKKYRVMNGLLLLSKYPIEMPVFHEFPAGHTQREEDALARKGIITATIVLPDGLRFRVGVTHANCNLGGQSPADMADLAFWTDIGDLAYWTIMGAKIGPAIMMGDLNVSDTDAAKYNQMVNIFAGVGALDAVRQLNKGNSATVDGAKNLLHQEFFPKKPDDEFQYSRLDYVFYRPDGPGLTIKPESAKVITDWKYVPGDGKNVEMDLSDHYPVMVTFGLWAGPKPR